MKGLIVIPAREGSRRLKKKNKKLFLKKPLIQHSIDFAKKIKLTPYILVTTDDSDILKIAFKNNLLTPWLRPKKISGAKSSSFSFMMHAIYWFEKTFFKLDYVILLQPTSPFRKKNTINKMFKIFKKAKTSVVSFTENLGIGKKKYYIINKKKIVNNKESKIKANVTGNIYINSIDNLKKYKKFVNNETVPYITNDKLEIIDIDNLKQFNEANKIGQKFEKNYSKK